MEKKEAMKILKDFHDKSALFSVRTALDTIIPELKESEDERIRKELIFYFQEEIPQCSIQEHADKMKEFIAWLEKQDRHANFLNNIQIGDKVTRNEDGMLVNLSQLKRVAKPAEKQSKIAPTEDELEALRMAAYEPTKNWSEKLQSLYEKLTHCEQGEQKETLCDKCKKAQPSHSCQDITALGRCALEKQGEQKFMPQEYADAFDEFMSHIPEKEPEFSESCYNYDDMVSAIQFGIKWQQQHDSIVKVKPKYEPKFHKGDWVIGRATENEPRQIAEITEDGYKSTYGGWYGFSFEEDMHLWTIKDAKDGDVLIDKSGSRECPFIFKETKPSDIKTDMLNPLAVLGYCGIGGAGFTKGSGWGDTANCIYYPATKEQRDLLFQKMKEAGYEWDGEKKELKKIEQKPAWSEEDEKIALSVEQVMNCASLLNIVPEKIDKIRTWLKSLKDRYTWKPSDEQLKQLGKYCPDNTALTSLYEHLKQL